MGLEPMGYAVQHRERLWIDPVDYAAELSRAVDLLDVRGVPVAVYNHPWCVLPADVRRFAARSISEWKNDLLPACQACAARASCPGFFASAVRRGWLSRGVRPLPVDPAA